MKLFLLLYEFILMPIVIALLPIAALFNQKVSLGLRLRKEERNSAKSLKNCVWIHVSSGEWEYARPLARLLKSRGQKILVTHFSPSVRKSLENSKEVDVVYALPIDSRFALKNFYERFQPQVLMLARTDLWPVLLSETKGRKIPIVLFSATLSREVLEAKGALAQIFHRYKLSFIDRLYCVSDEDRLNLDRLVGASRTKVIGDTRYDQAIFRLQNAKPLKNITDPKYRYFVAGSTWYPDETVLVPAISRLKDKALRFIIVPHEPSEAHIQQLKELLSKFDLNMRKYSEIQDSGWSDHGDVCVVDQVGVLAELYLKADFALVGNSFLRNAVHSVMEPLAAGCLTFVGPFHKNNREAIEFSQKMVLGDFHSVEVVKDSHSLVMRLTEALALDRTLKEKIRGQVSTKVGASQRLMDDISPLL